MSTWGTVRAEEKGISGVQEAEQWFGINEFEQMASWLDQEARLYDPDADYAKAPIK